MPAGESLIEIVLLFHLDRVAGFTYSPPAMIRYIFYPCPLAAIFLLAAAPAPCVGDESAIAEQAESGVDGLLVLRNGNLVRGKIFRLQEHYRVERDRSELMIPSVQVEMLCSTIDEVYQKRREQRTGSSADTHVELARWCLRHGLLEYAARELLDARGIDPEQRQLQIVERQLRMALQHRENARRKNVPKQAPESPTEEELQSVEQVPAWAKKLFVRQIQPMVIHSCATTGCHHAGSSETFQLNRLALEGAGHPETTLRNLSAVVNQLDWKHPTESNLLVRAREAHGSQGTRPAASLERRKYHMLQTWVEQLAIARRNAPVNEVQLVQYEQEDAIDALPLLRKAIQEEEESDASSDPFDPAAFNQQHSKK